MALSRAIPCVSRPSVLLLEDNPLHGALLQMVLEASGMEVFKASAASEAARIAGKQAPDLILVSWDTEGLDGRALLAFLRLSVPELAGVPVLLMTDRNISGTLRMVLAKEGYLWILQKPLVPTSLPKLIQRTIADHTRRLRGSRVGQPVLGQFVGCGATASGFYLQAAG
ncbi:MAG: response regulator [Planctomycetota bacterium]